MSAAAAAVIGAASFAVHAASDPLVDLKAGADALEAGRYPAAISTLKGLPQRLPKLADYAAWFLASAQSASKDYAGVPATLNTVFQQSPPSPLVPRAALLAAGAYTQNNDPAAGLELLRKYYSVLPQPKGDLAMAVAFDGTGDDVSAAIYYQRVYFGFPLTAEAAQSGTEIAKLQTQLGEKYPPALPTAMLGRALKLLDAGQAARAKKELELLVPQLGGVDRDLARVRIGVAHYTAKENAVAYRYLSALEVASPEADAERLYYLAQSARRLNNLDEMDSWTARLGRLHPNSPWRLKAVTSAADRYLTENKAGEYEPLYRACFESFPQDKQAAGCHWKVAWAHYIRRSSDAQDLLRAHLRLFPASENASSALYFLGRLAEQSRDRAAARAYYEEIAREYPNQYYAVLARDRMTPLAGVTPAPAASEFLRAVNFPQRARTTVFDASVTSQARIDRAKMLVLAGLKEWAEIELRYGAQTGDQPHLLAMQLGALIGDGRPAQAIRYIKSYAGNYLFLPIESAPQDFWRLAFPLPYRADLERFSKQNKLDPFLMAALIRQESEFDAGVTSSANARGLTQIEPATGRELSRKLKIPAYTTAKLFQPSLNLQFGTYYLRVVTDQLGGHTEAALAAYNAGMSRAKAWLTWGDFKEPAEFVETVPFTQTRGYIQAVLRNADAYRRIYTTQPGPQPQ
ncbi:MAG TPA: transglycosylase SLT domain-containing protein [Bryobacteraceae bacterium]|nr:transglycosylase SLT domain-containing protein [Bryobacteraceae bacterium]